MKGLLFVDFKIYKAYFNSNTGFRAILRSNDKNHYKQGDRDDNEAGTGSAETLEPLSRFIERSCAGRTGQGWQGVFHRMILKQLPAELMAEKFNKYTGRPTKELYSMCGLLLIMNYFGWTLSQTRMNYMVDFGDI